MGQNIEGGIADRMQTKAVQEGVELVVNTQAAVLEVVIVETQTRIDKTLRHAIARGLAGQVLEVMPDLGDHVRVEAKVTNLAYGWPLDIAENDRSVVRCRQLENILTVQR